VRICGVLGTCQCVLEGDGDGGWGAEHVRRCVHESRAATSFVLVIVREKMQDSVSEVRVVDRGKGAWGRTVGALAHVCCGEEISV
jgi:hypothetical protein